MDQKLIRYLTTCEDYLRVLPIQDRLDILQELRSDMAAKSRDGMPAEEIIQRFGEPKQLSIAYLGDCIVENKVRGLSNYWLMMRFSAYVGLGALLLLPVTIPCAIAFLLSGLILPIAGLIKRIAFLFGFDLPLIGVYLPNYTSGPVMTFFTCPIVGTILFTLGYYCMKISETSLRSVIRQKKENAVSRLLTQSI